MSGVIVVVVGISIGFIAFVVTWLEEQLIVIKVTTMQKMFLGEGKTWYASAYMFYVTFSMMCGMIAGTMTIYWAKKSMGSGIPELMGILGGISIPEFFSYKVLVAKSFGVVLAVAGTLCVGKEGPLAHIGACCAVLVLYLPFEFMKQY